MDKKKKKQEIKNKTKSAKVRLKGELVEKSRFENGITSQKAAAEKAGLNIRTYQRAIGGDPISLRTANKICEALKLDLKEVVIIELENMLLTVDEGEQDTKDSDPIIAAFVQANDAIENNLARLGTWGIDEACTVFTLLLTRYGSAIARHTDDLEVGIDFVNNACMLAKEKIPHFFESEDEDTTDSD